MKKLLLTLTSVILVNFLYAIALSDCHADFEYTIDGSTVTFTDASVAEPGPILSWTWNFGDGSTSDDASPAHTYTEPGEYEICLTIHADGACYDEECETIFIGEIECAALFTFEATGLTVEFDNGSESTADIIEYTWEFGDGSTSDAVNPTHTFAVPGAYNICLEIYSETAGGDACADVYCLVIEVGGADCVASMEVFGDCLEKHFYNTTDGDLVSQSWDFGDGGESDLFSPYHTYAEAGIYIVCLTIETEDGCTDDVCTEIEVSDCGAGECEATMEFFGDCLEIHFYNTSDGDMASQSWDFGDGSSSDLPYPYHTYDEAGSYTVCLTIETSDGCSDYICTEIEVSDCSGDCTASIDIWAYDGLAVHFFGSVEPAFEDVTYTWNWGDGSTTTEEASSEGTDPWHDYVLAGTYEVCLTIETGSGCIDEICTTITVGAGSDCFAEFDFEIGDAGVAYFNSSTEPGPGDVVSYWWSFGDGTFGDGADPSHEYDETGEYDVCLVVTFYDGCIAEYCHEIFVEVDGGGEDCEAVFEFSSECLEIHFFEAVTGVDVAEYAWEFGDGTESDDANPVHEYDVAGAYNVCLSISTADGCVDVYCLVIEVEDCSGDCSASFEWEEDSSLIYFYSNTEPGAGDVTSYYWSFGDGTTSDAENPTHEYEDEGEYLVCLTVTFYDGCTAEYCHEVHVTGGGGGGSDCEAYFNVLSIEPDGTGWFVNFNNESTADGDIGEVLWYFGDGSTADTYDAEHFYETPGVYNVCIVITSADGTCTSEYCHEIEIGEGDGECEADFEWSEDGLTVTFTAAADEGGSTVLSYIWSFDDGTFSFDENPVHEFDAEGEYEVCLSIITFDSCFDTHCETIHIEEETASCEAYFTVESITVTDDGWLVNFTNESTGFTDDFHWTFGDGGASEFENPDHIYDVPGIYTVCLSVGNEGTDCFDEYCLNIFIGDDEDCIDESVVDSTFGCTEEYDPVCGCDGVTYTNECYAYYYHGVLYWTDGACATGIDEEKIISNINIYPNPVSTTANIVLNSLQNGQAKIIMLDMLGKNVLNIYSGNIINGTNYFTVDISAMPAGMYFIIAEIENKEVVTQKLIIE